MITSPFISLNLGIEFCNLYVIELFLLLKNISQNWQITALLFVYLLAAYDATESSKIKYT
jgi:hypothetical protein